jgi:hypothetical protein
LLLALVAVFVVAAVVLLLATWLQIRCDVYRVERRAVELSALADAAMAETMARLAVDRHFPGVAERPFGDGLIASTVDRLGPLSARLRASGRLGGWVEVIDAEVNLGSPGPRVVSWQRSRRQGTGDGD